MSNSKLLSNSIWAFSGQLGYVFLGLLANVFLARMLTPEDFGMVGIAMFFIGVSGILVDGGVGGALIRKGQVSDEDYSTVFIINLSISFILVFLLVFTADYISQIFELPQLKSILIALSSLLIINALTVIQNVKLIREMKFKCLSILKITSFAISALAGVTSANLGAGVWSIVIMQVMFAFLFMLMLWVCRGGVIKMIFSKKSFNEVFSFGFFTTSSSLLNVVFDNIYQLIIGKYFNVMQVGYFYQAKKLSQATDSVFRSVILQVFYSYLARFQTDKNIFYTKFCQLDAFMTMIVGLAMSLIYIYAEQLILLLLGVQWMKAIYYLELLSIVGFFTLQELSSRNIFKIYDQTHKLFYLEFVKKLFQTFGIAIGVFYSDLQILLIGFVGTSVFGYLITACHSLKIIDKTVREEACRVLKNAVAILISVYVFMFLLEVLSVALYYKLFFVPVYVFLYVLVFMFTGCLKWEDLKRLSGLFFFKRKE